MNESVIVSAARTPTGKFLGALKTSQGALSSARCRALRRWCAPGIDPAIVDECIMGNVVQAGNGQNPARQAALHGGLHERVAALTINKVCGSGLKAVMLAAQGIATGDIDVAVAGGMESMSNAPYLLPRVREGLRMGNGAVVDSIINDGLWCAFENCHMGMSGEVVAERLRRVARRRRTRTRSSSHRKAAHATSRRLVHGRNRPDPRSPEEGGADRRRPRREHPRGHDRRSARRAQSRPSRPAEA